MCGIAGFCNLSNKWKENIERMNDRILHRGPDQSGIWSNSDNSVVFGHRRLSILDLSDAGRQPMISHNGRYVIAFNGEIYNYAYLRDSLKKIQPDIKFLGHSDTEILLEHISSFGLNDTLNKAKGMFALAVYDNQTGRLMLSRDRIGEKPLYYGFVKGGFVFASELGAIRNNLYFDNELDTSALSLYFRYGYIPSPYSIYKNIYKLDAGCILTINPPYSDYSITKYWDILEKAAYGQNNRFEGSFEEASEELERLIKESIRMQMVADVPVGAFLSGGIDSTTVAAIMQSVSDKPIKTFSIGFDYAKYNEAPYAKENAKYLGTDHTELYISDKDAIDVISKIPYIYCEPFADPSQIPTFLVSKLAREKVTVSLSGDAGDELFCGYTLYEKVNSIWKKIKYIPYPFRVAASKTIGLYSNERYGSIHAVSHFLNALNETELYEKVASMSPGIDDLVVGGSIPSYKYTEYQNKFLKDDPKSNYMLMDLLMYHPDELLVKVDRSAMAVSLESRVPFLDRDIVEFSFSLPIEYKYVNGNKKRILKDVLYRYIPKEMMDRPKMGFSVPVGEWCRNGELFEWMNDLLNSDTIKQQRFLNPDRVERMRREFIEKGDNEDQIWKLCMFEQWARDNI